MNRLEFNIAVGMRQTEASVSAAEAPMLVVRLAIDDHYYPEAYTVNWFALVESATCDGELPIIACKCGSKTCAERVAKVAVNHDGNAVRWRVRDPIETDDDDPAQPPRYVSYCFDRRQYVSAIRQVLHQAKAILTQDETIRTYPYGSERSALISLAS